MTSRLDAIEQRCREAWATDLHRGESVDLLLAHARSDVLDLVAVARAAKPFVGCWRVHDYLGHEHSDTEPYDTNRLRRCGTCPGCTLHDALASPLAEETT